jgi:hypothetical protein
VQAGLEEVFRQAGVRGQVPTILFNDEPNPERGEASLLVRASMEDMEVIQATVEFLGGSSTEQKPRRDLLLTLPTSPTPSPGSK